MSRLVDRSISIFEAIENMKAGKYVMPAFQRSYIWSMGQIEKLWDSILLDYPISTFLFWHLDKDNVTIDTYFYQFVKECKFDFRRNAKNNYYDYTAINTETTDTAILDGQQRLTSLYLSLVGSFYLYPKHQQTSKLVSKVFIELNKFRADTDEEYNSKKFDISFTEKVSIVIPTKFELKSIMNPAFRDAEKRKEAIEKAVRYVPDNSKDYAKSILSKLCVKIYDEKLIRITEAFEMNHEDALEMFVRFNSGGNPLR